MTVSSEVSRTDFVGSGSLAVYSTTFAVKDTTEVRVFTQDADGQDVELALGADFSAVLNGAGLCTITLTAGPLANGYKLSLQRGIPYTQTVAPGAAYNATTMSVALDRLAMENIRIKGDLARAIKIPYLEAGGDGVTKLDSPAATRANQALVFDASGNVMAGASVSVSASAFAQTLLDDTTASEARTTLGIPTSVLLESIATRTLVGRTAAGTGVASAVSPDDVKVIADSSITERDFSLRFAERINVRDYGAIGDGSTHPLSGVFGSLAAAQAVYPHADSLTNELDWAAIQLAINTASKPAAIYLPKGKYRVNKPIVLPATQGIILCGDPSGGRNTWEGKPTHIQCKQTTGYLINDAAVTGGSLSDCLTVEDIFFDGSDGALADASGTTTCTGVYQNGHASADVANLAFRRCAFGYFSSASSIMLRFNRVFDSIVEDCNFLWCYGLGFSMVATGGVSTTNEFRGCYFNYLRQVGEVLGDVTDLTFRNCIFESSTSGICLGLTFKAAFYNCYFENIGYKVNNQTKGVTIKNSGISFGGGILDGQLDVALFSLYGNVTMVACHFGYLISAATNADIKGWFQGAGRGSASGSYGGINLIGCGRLDDAETRPFFYDEGTPSRTGFQYVINDAWGRSTGRMILIAADLRALTSGLVRVLHQDGGSHVANVRYGILEYYSDFNQVYTTFPASTNAPVGGYVVGDQFVMAPNAAGGEAIRFICTVAGTPGTWDTHTVMALSKSASVSAAGTTTFGGTLSETGEMHEWRVFGTSSNTAIDYSARVQVAKLPSGRAILVNEDIDSGNTVITLTGTGDAYTVTVTNNNAFSVNYYIRLVTGGRTHA